MDLTIGKPISDILHELTVHHVNMQKSSRRPLDRRDFQPIL